MSNAKTVPFETTLEVRDACLCLHAQRAARVLARRFDEALRPLDLTNWQFSLLMALNRPEPPAMGAVAELLGIDRTTLTAALKPLIRRGLVRSAPDRDDRRSRRLTLTRRAHALLSDALPIWKETQASVEALLASSDPERLRRDLRAVSQRQAPEAHSAR